MEKFYGSDVSIALQLYSKSTKISAFEQKTSLCHNPRHICLLTNLLIFLSCFPTEIHPHRPLQDPHSSPLEAGAATDRFSGRASGEVPHWLQSNEYIPKRFRLSVCTTIFKRISRFHFYPKSFMFYINGFVSTSSTN